MEPISLRADETVLLVDTSYYVFYRFFATAKWMALQAKPVVIPAVPEGAPVYAADLQLAPPIAPQLNMANPAFRAAFVKHMEADIAKLKKTHGLAKTSRNLVFCRDCYRREIWRTALYPDYKNARIVSGTFDPAAFQVVYAHVQAAGYPMVWHAALEADDVAYLVHQRIRQEGGLGPCIVFITSDHDYLQIKDDRNAIYQMDGKDVFEMGQKKGTCDIELKILKGDKSDNIAPVLTPAQVRKYSALDAAGRAALLDALGKRPAYELNRTLMHWGCIPADLCEAFNAALTLTWEPVAAAPCPPTAPVAAA
jgi:5'-3' exonuclease